MFNTRVSALGLCAAVALLASSAALFASDAPKVDAPKMEVSKEAREKMASAHEQMAACLRSAKSLDDCHHEMMKAHESMHGEMKGEHDCDKMMKRHEHMEHEREVTK
jgi:ribosomal protein L4